LKKQIIEPGKLGHISMALIGQKNYYPKLEYKNAIQFNLKIPYEVPDKNYFVDELIKNGLKGVSRMVEYPKLLFV
jgi:predicted N-acetyltransferase YhbS